MTTLLVANDGGHIMQLHTLRPRLGIGDDVVWVTPKTPQTESLLAGERVHWAEPCPPRDLARRDAQRRAAAGTSSTGTTSRLRSAPERLWPLPCCPQARLRHVETVYIESATRMAEPSVSGRLLSLVPGIRTFSQSEALARHHWHYLASPWDLYRVAADGGSRPVRRVSGVSLGTQPGFGFRRLVERVVAILPGRRRGALADRLHRRVGAGHRRPARRCRPPRWNRRSREADAVVAHAGTGIALAALEAGRLPGSGAAPRHATASTWTTTS